MVNLNFRLGIPLEYIFISKYQFSAFQHAAVACLFRLQGLLKKPYPKWPDSLDQTEFLGYLVGMTGKSINSTSLSSSSATPRRKTNGYRAMKRARQSQPLAKPPEIQPTKNDEELNPISLSDVVPRCHLFLSFKQMFDPRDLLTSESGAVPIFVRRCDSFFHSVVSGCILERMVRGVVEEKKCPQIDRGWTVKKFKVGGRM